MSLSSSCRPRTQHRRPSALAIRRLSAAVIAGLLVLLAAPPDLLTAHADAGLEAGAAHRARSQSFTIETLPPIYQPGERTASSSRALSVVVATFYPARVGRSIVLERRTHHGWRPRATVLTNTDGRAEFFVPVAGNRLATYRAVAGSFRGLREKSTTPFAAHTWSDADFSDEFSGTGLSAAWEHRIQFYNPWGGRACSKGSPAAVAVADGALHLSSMLDPTVAELCTATDQEGNVFGQYPYRLNGHISTQHAADFLYGVGAARMKFQRDPGAHVAFWLQPRGLLTTGPTPWGAEIDVIEWYGSHNGRGRMSSTVHAPLPNGEKFQLGGSVAKPDQYLLTRSDSWWRRYHVFSVQWTPTEYVFRISGHEVWRTDQGVSHDPEFLILSMLSSDFELPTLGARESSPQTASVDWVKFWQTEPPAIP